MERKQIATQPGAICWQVPQTLQSRQRHRTFHQPHLCRRLHDGDDVLKILSWTYQNGFSVFPIGMNKQHRQFHTRPGFSNASRLIHREISVQIRGNSHYRKKARASGQGAIFRSASRKTCRVVWCDRYFRAMGDTVARIAAPNRAGSAFFCVPSPSKRWFWRGPFPLARSFDNIFPKQGEKKIILGNSDRICNVIAPTNGRKRFHAVRIGPESKFDSAFFRDSHDYKKDIW